MKYVINIALLIALTLGANYALAASTWVGPTASAPGNNVDAPINTSATAQVKSGQFSVREVFDSDGLAVFGNSFFGGTVQIQDGTEGVDKVLASDASGNAEWKEVNEVSSGGGLVIFQAPIQLTLASTIDITSHLPVGVTADSAIIRADLYTSVFQTGYEVYVQVAHPDEATYSKIVHATPFDSNSYDTIGDVNDAFVKLKNNQFKAQWVGTTINMYLVGYVE